MRFNRRFSDTAQYNGGPKAHFCFKSRHPYKNRFVGHRTRMYPRMNIPDRRDFRKNPSLYEPSKYPPGRLTSVRRALYRPHQIKRYVPNVGDSRKPFIPGEFDDLG